MSDHLILATTPAESTSQFTIADLQAMKPLGKPIPIISQDNLSRFVFTTKAVDKAPESEKKGDGRFSRLKERLKATSPAERAYEKADVIVGKYYSLGPYGQVLETTITRRDTRSKMEKVFCYEAVDPGYLSKYGRRDE